MLTSAINYGQCVRAGLKKHGKKPRKYSYSVGCAIAAAVAAALVVVMLVTLTRVEGKKIAAKTVLREPPGHVGPVFMTRYAKLLR